MDVLNRLRSTVSNLSTVLPGNPVTREYEIVRHVGSAGPGLLWKVFQAIKRSTKQEAAVFVLEKKQLERYSKRDRDVILEALKNGVSQLTRLRHPSVLTVQHPLEESRESLAFATEPVFCSLANVLGHHENMPVPPPPELKDYQLYDVEIKYGLLQVSEGLAFLHNDVKRLHRNLCPESIIVNKDGAWKIAGFDFSVASENPQDPQPSYPGMGLEADLPPAAQPNLDFVAPECILADSCDNASDMFSLGALIYCIYNKGTPLYTTCSSLSSLKHCVQQLKQLPPSKLHCLPEEAREHVKMLLSITPDIRPDAHQFSKLKFLEDIGVKTLQYLDSLYQWDNLQKSHVYKGLPQVLAQMPKRVSLHRVLPCLVKEYVNPDMVPFVLPSVLLIAEEASKEEFVSLILPDLVPIFKLQEPVQVLLIFMQKMELLLTKCPPNDIRNNVLPMVYRSLESDAQQIQELCLNIIPEFARLIEYPAMKNALLPRIKKLCLSTNYLSVRVNCLVCLGKLLEHLDKWLVLDEILPVLPEIKSKEPAVLMGILGIYKLAMTHKKLGITKDIMASKVIPFLMPLTIENGLTLNQFNAIICVVKDMVSRVENEHRAKLEQLNSIKQEQRSALDMTKVQPISQDEIIPGFKQQADKADSYATDVYQDLGIANFSSNSNSSGSAQKAKPQQPLSLEEKQRLAREQDNQQLLRAQPSLVPKSTPTQSYVSTRTTASPRDLTSTLINTNLASLSLKSPPATNMNLVSNSPGPTSSGFIMNPCMQQPPGMMPSGEMASGLWNFSPQAAGVPRFQNNTVTAPKSINLSAFDTLLDMNSTKNNRLSMNQMTPQLPPPPGQSPVQNFTLSVQSQPASANVTPKPTGLAKNELDDFLG